MNFMWTAQLVSVCLSQQQRHNNTVLMPLYSVLYPGSFWSRYTVLDAPPPPSPFPPPKKVLYSKVSFLIKQIKNSFLFHEVFRKLDILQDYLWFKYSMAKEKRRDFIKKKTWNSYLIPDVPSFRTCNRWPFKMT